mgnify:CR=1 FL=1
MKVIMLLRELLRVLYKMAEALLHKSGNTVDTSGVTATDDDVLENKTYLKSDGEVGTGKIKELGSPEHTLNLNATLYLPAGHYSGGHVRQNIATSQGATVYAGKKAVTVDTTNKYMTGNIIQAPIKNLIPAFIKKGEYVGGVGPGEWEGYINEDPNTPFLYGTFGPGHGMASLLYNYGSQKGYAGISKQCIDISTEPYDFGGVRHSESIAIVLTQPINLSSYNRIKILATSSTINVAGALIYRNRNESWMRRNGVDNPDLGERIMARMTLQNGSETVLDVSGYSGTGYVYLALSPGTNASREASIYYIKYE